MTDRVKKLREQSVTAVPHVSPERAVLMTEFCQRGSFLSPPMTRALAFMHIMENKTICVNDGELIVGERGPAPKATYTFPELCCHTIQDLNILNSREKVWFRVSDETNNVFAGTIIPFWKGKTLREKIFAEMTPEWHAAYDAGIFTEFMEQRAPGHTVLDDKIYRKGMLDFKQEIDASLAALNYIDDPEAYNKSEELRAMNVSIDAVLLLAKRYADEVHRLAEKEQDAARRSELFAIENICRRVPAHAPETFWEALQYYWFVHLGVITELNPWDAFNPGRLDQHLYPFYRKGIDDKSLTKEKARELLECFWVKFNNQPAPPKVGVTAAESSTYTDFANINTGGMKQDGSDGVNDLTHLILDVIDEMKLVQPSSNIQLSKKNPEEFLKHACRVISHGRGQPSIFNADTIVDELLRQGKSLEDARCGGASGCVETGAFGKESYILTGYFNLPKVLEVTLHNGIDPRTGTRIGIETGEVATFASFDELLQAFRKQLRHFIEIKLRGNNVIERIYASYMPVPFLSVLIDDCIAKGKDYNAGGARYNTNYIQGVGIGTITDSLAALRSLVFEKHSMTMNDVLGALAVDFAGLEPTRLLLQNKMPKYGNDDDKADDLMRWVFNEFYEVVNGRPNTKGGCYRINMLPTTCHVYFGSMTGATPDGRRAWTPLSEGISPVQGADRHGPTAVLKSAAKMDHARTGGTLLNQKFSPQLLDSEKGIENLAHLVRSYFTMGGHHIQFNVVNAQTLREAQAH
ncbi:MAG TPA: trans-4-hydroxy-L-proline dehydratase, partial [Bacteroidota bacterium]|nr:trans-4-hydroxy-L-proline dehydratase [Bacteroidota bacterium]